MSAVKLSVCVVLFSLEPSQLTPPVEFAGVNPLPCGRGAVVISPKHHAFPIKYVSPPTIGPLPSQILSVESASVTFAVCPTSRAPIGPPGRTVSSSSSTLSPSSAHQRKLILSASSPSY